MWNADRGYGAIVPEQGGQEVFVHISAFPVGSAPPALGEAVSFEIVSTSDGRKQAARVQRIKRTVPGPEQRFLAPAPPRRYRRYERNRRLALVGVALMLAVGIAGWLHLSSPRAEQVAKQRVSTIASLMH